MRWTGSRVQPMSLGWQALIQRTLTEASCLDLRRPNSGDGKEARWKDRRNGEKREIYDMCQGKGNTYNLKGKCEFPTISTYTVYNSIHKKMLSQGSTVELSKKNLATPE